MITAQHLERDDHYVIEIPASKVEGMTAEFENDYAAMAANLKILNRRMVLLNPVPPSFN